MLISCFPGDEEMVATLESRVSSFNVTQWWEEANAIQVGRKAKKEAGDTAKLHNPYAGVVYAWQLTETVDDFLARLPPKTTEVSEHVPWIFICNPYIPRGDRLAAQSRLSRGNEDEAPEEEGSQLGTLIEGGVERMNILGNFMNGIRKTTKSQNAKNMEMGREKKAAVQDILALAQACKVRAGKASAPRPMT